jgi:transcriptional regulator with XRE-family HTH domain
MEISKLLSDDAILEALGNRIARCRLSRQMTQAALAEEAGLSKRTVERIEGGGTSQLLSLIRVLRVLDLLSGLDQLVPDTGPRPMDLLKLKGKQRQRARSKPAADPASEPWSWGEP